MNFQEALTNVYCHNPCVVLPNALWKTMNNLDGYQTSFKLKGEDIVSLQIWGNCELILIWDADRGKLSHISAEKWKIITFALLHDDYLSQIPINHFHTEPYFRLINCFQSPPISNIKSGFEFMKVNIPSEAKLVANFINTCYQDISIKEDTVLNWTQYPTFDPDLWIWVFDKNKNTFAGLGIADFDKTIREGSLEWIQTHPDYRRQGIGKLIVGSLLQRLYGKADFVTVAGRADNLTKPDLLYRHCGFTGKDIWHVLRSK